MPVTKKTKTVTEYTCIVSEVDGQREFTLFINVVDLNDKDEVENEIIASIESQTGTEWTMDELEVKYMFKGTHAPVDLSSHSLQALIKKWTYGQEIARKLTFGDDMVLIVCDTNSGINCYRFFFCGEWQVSADHQGVDWCDAFDWLVEKAAEYDGDQYTYDKCMEHPC